MQQAQNIDQVIDMLDDVIATAINDDTRFAFFASLYRIMTIGVKVSTASTELFREPDQVRQLAVNFSNRYFDAYHDYRKGKTLTQSWRVAFDATEDDGSIILQHILMGINAHISLDLGICVAEMNPDGLPENVKHDFFVVNDIINGLVDGVQHALGTVSPWLVWIDRIGWRGDEAISNYSMIYARNKAWQFAEALVEAPYEDWEAMIANRDKRIASFANQLRTPSLMFRPVTALIRLREHKDISTTADAIASIEKHTLTLPAILDLITSASKQSQKGRNSRQQP